MQDSITRYPSLLVTVFDFSLMTLIFHISEMYRRFLPMEILVGFSTGNSTKFGWNCPFFRNTLASMALP